MSELFVADSQGHEVQIMKLSKNRKILREAYMVSSCSFRCLAESAAHCSETFVRKQAWFKERYILHARICICR